MTMTYARKSLPFLVILAIVTLGCRKSQIAVDDVALDPSSSKRASTPSARREVLLRAVNSALERKRIPAPRRAALLGSLRVLSSSNGAVSDAQKILAALPRLLAKNLNLTAEELASTLLTVADSLPAALSEAAKAEGKPLKASDTETARAGLYAAASLALVSAIKDSSEALRLLSDVFQELGVDTALVVATSNALASTWKLSEGSKKALLGVLGVQWTRTAWHWDASRQFCSRGGHSASSCREIHCLKRKGGLAHLRRKAQQRGCLLGIELVGPNWRWHPGRRPFTEGGSWNFKCRHGCAARLGHVCFNSRRIRALLGIRCVHRKRWHCDRQPDSGWRAWHRRASSLPWCGPYGNVCGSRRRASHMLGRRH